MPPPKALCPAAELRDASSGSSSEVAAHRSAPSTQPPLLAALPMLPRFSSALQAPSPAGMHNPSAASHLPTVPFAACLRINLPLQLTAQIRLRYYFHYLLSFISFLYIYSGDCIVKTDLGHSQTHLCALGLSSARQQYLSLTSTHSSDSIKHKLCY